MNVKKAIKRIAALAAGTTMVTATIMGAAADLGSYPAPFVDDNGMFGGRIVIGTEAQVQDVYGAIDLAASLQSESKVMVDANGGSTDVSVTGGAALESGSDDLIFGDAINVPNSGKYDDNEFPDYLMDGTVEDDDGSDYDYEQYINVPDLTIAYVQDDDYQADPFFALDTTGATATYLEYVVDFTDELDVVALTDSETIDMFGKTYTFDPNHTDDGDLIMYGSDVTVTVNQGEPVTVEVSGVEYTIEVLGGNSDQSTANIRVTGQGTSTKSLTSGASRTMAGLDIYVDDVFISNIGENSIAVSVFVGSNKIVIPAAAVTDGTDFEEIELNGEDFTGVEAAVATTGVLELESVESIAFRVDMTEFEDVLIADDYEYIMAGESFVDPLFGFSLEFDGFLPAVPGNRPVIDMSRSGDAYTFSFENNDGDDFDIETIKGDGSDLFYEDLQLSVAAAGTMAKGNIFLLNEGNGDEDDITQFYEVTKIQYDSGTPADSYVSLKDLASGTTKNYKLNDDEIGDTTITVDAVAVDESTFSLSGATVARVWFNGGFYTDLPSLSGTQTTIDLTFYEDAEDMDDATEDILNLTVDTDSDDDIKMSNAAWTSGTNVNDDGADYRYGFSEFGTWFEQEINDDGDFLKIYYEDEESKFNVFLNSPDAVVIKRAGGSGSAYMVNELVVGQIVVWDEDAKNLLGNTPLIVVGGPCVNTIALDLMGYPENCEAGFEMNKAMIKWFSGKKALLVAGMSGEDTVGATYVLADYEKYGLMGDEVSVSVAGLDNLEVTLVQ